jgi:RNA polymerase sigma-70 factor (ECF subfamily)
MSKSPSWSSLVAGVLDKNSEATHDLIERSRKPLFTFCFHLTHNKQLAEDLTHDAFIKALTSLHQLREPEAFPAWLKKIARSLFLDLKKSAAQSKQHLDWESLNPKDLNSLQIEHSDPDQMAALQVLHRLDVDDRLILILIDIQECSYQEASETLEIPVGTIKSRLFRAREKFLSAFEGTKPLSGSSLK